jgi:broad specificity phosphatase PhoE
MGELVLVRHGQASFFGRDYDELSALGRTQARALGDHWASHGVRFDEVYVGPRRRHHQTLEQVALAYRERGLGWPEPQQIEGLDEHQGLIVIKSRLKRENPEVGAMHPEDPGADDRERIVREFFRHYLEIMKDWARGNIDVPGVESWQEFRARSLRVLDLMCATPGRAVAFTSGGLVSSAAGWLLGLDEDRIIDLSAVLRNTALTEVRHSGKRRGLVSFNALPHLPDPANSTAV